MPLPGLDIKCFGRPEVHVPEQTQDSCLTWRKNIGLLVYLALEERKTRSRTRLRGMLWPEKPESDARHSLNGAVSQLRRVLGDGRLLSEADSLRLEVDGLTVDVFDFEEAIPNNPLEAAAIPRGEFLEGLTFGDAPEFERWIEQQRDRLHRAWAGTLLARGEMALAEGQFKNALDDASRVFELFPHSEPAAQLQARVAMYQGDVAEAKQLFRRFEERLRDVSAQPSLEFRRWIDELDTPPEHPPRSHSDDPPLMGRSTENTAAFAAVSHATAGGPYLLVIQGDPGMGKSRLASEVGKRFGLSGGLVYWARPVENDRDVAWSTLRTLMRGGLADAPGLAGTRPEALNCLAALVPELAERFTPARPTDRAQVGTALSAYVEAVTAERPIALVMDDAEFADEPTLEALHIALTGASGARALIVLTTSVRASGAPVELARMRADVDRSIAGTLVHLRALTEHDMAGLVNHLAGWCESEEQRRRLTKRLVSEVGGNPYLAVTFLRGLAQSPTLKHDFESWPRPNETLESALPMTLPDLLRLAVTARLSNLDQGGIEVLRAASIGPPTIDIALTAHLAGLEEDRVLDQCERLEQHHFLSYRDARYVFRAPLVQKVVRDECITAGRRRRLRTEAISFLRGKSGLAERTLCVELLLKNDPTPDNAHMALSLAEDALAEHQITLARRAVVAADQVIKAPDVAERLTVLRSKLSKARRTPVVV